MCIACRADFELLEHRIESRRRQSLNNSTIKFTGSFEWKAALTVTAAFCMLMALGFWQLDRAEEKRDKQRSIETRLNAKPLRFEELLLNPPKSLNFQRVYLQGDYLAGKSIFLVNKFYRGQAGFEVLTPFKIKASGRIVIVSRGWTPPAMDGKGLPELETPNGELHLFGTIHVPAGRSFFVDQPIRDEVWPLRLHHLDMKQIDQLFVSPVFPYVIRLDETMPGALYPYWPFPDMNPARSTSYAFQWFAMAFLLLIVTLLNATNIAEVIRSKFR